MDLLALTMAQVLIQILVAGIENRRIPDLDSELPVQLPIGFHAGPVLVKETMDVLIGSERIQCLAYIPNRSQPNSISYNPVCQNEVPQDNSLAAGSGKTSNP